MHCTCGGCAARPALPKSLTHPLMPSCPLPRCSCLRRYADTEILRNLSEEHRYNQLPAIAQKLGLDTKKVGCACVVEGLGSAAGNGSVNGACLRCSVLCSCKKGGLHTKV